jgi:hypothetical protein
MHFMGDVGIAVHFGYDTGCSADKLSESNGLRSIQFRVGQGHMVFREYVYGIYNGQAKNILCETIVTKDGAVAVDCSGSEVVLRINRNRNYSTTVVGDSANVGVPQEDPKSSEYFTRYNYAKIVVPASKSINKHWNPQ